jgi:hypothetical protein
VAAGQQHELQLLSLLLVSSHPLLLVLVLVLVLLHHVPPVPHLQPRSRACHQ